MDILNGSFSSFLQRQTVTMGTTGTLISDMWSENFRNLHAYASLILVFFINTNYDIKIQIMF